METYIDEKKAVAGFQKGNAGDFTSLYDAYAGKIYSFIYFKTQHRETAEDLTSKTFLKALDNLDSFDAGKGSFSTWLYSIARNNVIDFYRTKKNESDINDIWDLSSTDDIERDVEARQKLDKIEKYLKKLKSEHREMIILRVWNELSYKEISGITGKSEASCKMMFSRSIKELKKEMPLSLILYLFILRI